MVTLMLIGMMAITIFSFMFYEYYQLRKIEKGEKASLS